MLICINMQKIRLFHWFFQEIRLIKKILQVDWLRTRIFPIMGFVQEHSKYNFHYRKNLVKINVKFFQYIKKTPFLAHFSACFPILWPIFGSVTHNFIWVSSIMPKFRKKLIIQFKENARTNGRTEGRTDPIS